jgi:hypothetical protein
MKLCDEPLRQQFQKQQRNQEEHHAADGRRIENRCTSASVTAMVASAPLRLARPTTGTQVGRSSPSRIARIVRRGDNQIVRQGRAAGGGPGASIVTVPGMVARRRLDAAGEAALRARLTRAGRADVDLVRLDESGSTLLRWQIATTGVPLFEAQRGAFARFRAEAAAEYIDFAPALAHHGEIFRRRLIAQGERR